MKPASVQRPAPLSAEDPGCIAERYEVKELLGRGGTGSVYRVRDQATGAMLAVKRLSGRGGKPPSQRALESFEREFDTLQQLAHPRVVRAFDYGLDAGTPYYTMELLDGGDLRSQPLMEWRQACKVAYEVCSVLSLLHSRKLVHRDLTPRNIRLTVDGQAKVIDFGLLSPMGPARTVAGTPPYLAPELAHHLSLDGRADLFALGCTLYHILTKSTVFPARTIAELPDIWRRTPTRVSLLNPEVPEPLENLVHALVRLSPDSRPRSAAEVMYRLRPFLADPPDAALSAPQAYLSAPALVARDEALVRLRKQAMRSARGRGGGFLITGAPGTGRSRMLDVFMLEARLLGGLAARAGASEAAQGPFGAAQALVHQLHMGAQRLALEAAAADPTVLSVLFDTDNPAADLEPRDLVACHTPRAQLQAALRAWLMALAERRPLSLALDDLEKIDEPSAALLASLALEAESTQIAYAVTTREEALDAPGPALSVVMEQARPMPISAMSPAQTEQLLSSVFGDVPNLQATSRALYSLSGGRPKACMDLAQHLVDRDVIRYDRGAWQLPHEVDSSTLPASIEAALEAAVGELAPAALAAGRALAVAVTGRLDRTGLIRVVEVPHGELDAALSTLRRVQLITGGRSGYAIIHRSAATRLLDGISAQALGSLHDRLAALYARADANPIVVAHHAMQGSDPSHGVDALLEDLQSGEAMLAVLLDGMQELGGDHTARTLLLASEQASRLGCKMRDRCRLWTAIANCVVRGGADVEYWQRIPPAWLDTLKRCSGFSDWHDLGAVADPACRLRQAVAAAAARYQSDPEDNEVVSPEEATAGLVRYAANGGSIANRTLDLSLSRQLPALLEPLAGTHPLVAGMVLSLRSAFLTNSGANDASSDLIPPLLKALDAAKDSGAPWLGAVRLATLFHARRLAICDGMGQVGSEATDSISDPAFRVHAEQLNALGALYRGDWPAAEDHRRRAELVGLQHGAAPLFTLLEAELTPRFLAGDLAGLRATRGEIARLSAKHAGWVPHRFATDAYLHALGGEPDKALEELAALRAHQCDRTPQSPVLFSAIAVELQILVAQGRPELARERGLPALAQCQREKRSTCRRELTLALALADAELGDHEQAWSRVKGVIAEQRTMGVSGLLWGYSHEQLARVAICAEEGSAFEAAAQVAAEGYRVDQNSMFAGRYRQLIEDAERAGLGPTGSSGTSERRVVCGVPLHATAIENSDLPAEALRQLCAHGAGTGKGKRKGTEGWLFLLTEVGLCLSAASAPAPDPAAVQAFAQAQLELELDDGSLTLTTEDYTQTQGEPAGVGGNGSLALPGHHALALSTLHDGSVRIVGIAVLSGLTPERLPSEGLVAGLASLLLRSGDFRSVTAA
ncbi:MAG: serine/threonine-protein kinase [Myxococcales bacterium]|nr:serine/threonine-protein kinase [Myxococcales bacterium]